MDIIFEHSGKQYYGKVGDSIFLDKINEEVGKEIFFDKVLVYQKEIGKPYLDKKVKVLVEKHGKHKKIIVYKHKEKKNYQRKKGHRSTYTRVKILEII
ncbi:50S ribosomal protein L21 [symbiont of Argiope bruennichi]|uniref:50S ribosomal protein L21 n=1 Tax=symbiont of Argiope bruennichi TaxID=2810479 RepID=UPI003DA25FC5